ncbi:MAG: carotenoid oxygenase family protein [Pseudomonadota bacterium]
MATIAGSNEIPTCHGALDNLDAEHDYWLEPIDGELPADLVGTFYRNGPGRQRIGDSKYGHWFDGDGMLSAFSFTGGDRPRLHFRNRYVRTPKYVEETASESIRYRGFGTQIPGGFLKNLFQMPANPANTNTMYHGGKLLALNEGGRPYALTPENLETLGEDDYDGTLGRGDVFSAHGKVHPDSGDYINFGAGMDGMSWRGPRPCLKLYRIDPNGRVKTRNSVALDNFPFCHDFAITENYAVFFLGSIVFGNMLPMLVGAKTIADQISFDGSIPMQAIIIDLNTLTEVKRFETDPGAIIHFANAFEDGDEIVVDAMFADNFEANATLLDVFNPELRFNGGAYRRYRLDMRGSRIHHETVSDIESEFPTINTAWTGKRHGQCFTACAFDNGANSFFNGFQRVDFDGAADVVELPRGHYGSEPLFVPAQGATREDDGYILEVVYDGFAHRSELQAFRADNVQEQVFRARLDHHLPHQFHGFFTPDVFVA